ncbi:hypothetical protein P3342_012869 [Pyrenophora teres f. teres]|uniref:Uncharacterized protein n=2 Tax=Pyrenophora teres f. teres TaxID=97479 RepID=E3RFF1_PYRTT|nr:hypothetical protein PTT_06217 [Pyrenophora teres f. teres 0-1]KAE8826876.1 hypothetical protein HRS9139_08048 [Pyrenophora teres f. teres]KAE8832393.1 hypothetical protein PTNB85_06785 [Pyrenophora teres f. teres]KAE8836999.1 hypothetical protein HRS9122_07154 [Pyrenophora teres f. teres]KAE8856055.1 hypothetical protein PTNB29_08894 [Pyrenophora teres f. teres]
MARGANDRTDRRTDAKTSTPPEMSYKLLTRDQVPSWYAQNPYIITGFRPVTKSIPLCLRSLAYPHNETVNIYTHLIPAITALLCSYSFGKYFNSQFPHASWADEIVFRIYLTVCVICFGTSAAYHTLLCHSQAYESLCVRLDFVAIVMQIVGSFVPGLYFGFYCEPHLQKLYWTMIITLGALTVTAVIHPSLQGSKWRSLRLSTFVATGFSAFAPIIHGATIFSYSQMDQQSGLRYYYLEGVLVLAGVAFYAMHFPECSKPKKYDILGSSHQIFHVFIVLSALAHFYGLMTAFEWNYENQRCNWV